MLKNATNWEWSVNWLKNKMRETNDNSNNFMSLMGSKSQSNDDADTKTFQRTKSAQVSDHWPHLTRIRHL